MANHVDNLKIILTLQNEMLSLMFFCNCVLKEREGKPRYDKTMLQTFYSSLLHMAFFGHNSIWEEGKWTK